MPAVLKREERNNRPPSCDTQGPKKEDLFNVLLVLVLIYHTFSGHWETLLNFLKKPLNSFLYCCIRECLLILKQASSSADLLLRQMQSVAYTMPEYSTVRSMYGVGDRLAPILIAEIGDIRRFTSAKALNAYAGNDAPPYQSGQFEGTNRPISKRGSAYLRKACYQVMHSLKVHKPESDDFIKEVADKCMAYQEMDKDRSALHSLEAQHKENEKAL